MLLPPSPPSPPKLDKDISALIPKSAFTYDMLLSKVQQFNMDALGPLLHVLHRVKKGKYTTKELVAHLQTAIRLTGECSSPLVDGT